MMRYLLKEHNLVVDNLDFNIYYNLCANKTNSFQTVSNGDEFKCEDMNIHYTPRSLKSDIRQQLPKLCFL